MADQKLIEYIKKSLQAGHSTHQIKNALMNSGWYESDIDAAFSEIYSKAQPGAKAPLPVYKKWSFTEKLKKVLLSPDEFFENIRGEAGYKEAMKYLAIILLIPIAISYISLLIFGDTSTAGLPFLKEIVYLMPVVSYFLYIVMMFFAAGFLHLGVVIVGGKKGVFNTYKAAVYSSTPTFVFIWVYLFIFVIGPWAVIPLIIVALWDLYLTIKGLSKLQDMGMGRAFLALLIPSLIVFGIAAVFMSFLLIALFSTFYMAQPLPGGTISPVAAIISKII
jgi:hypothetical protein